MSRAQTTSPRKHWARHASLLAVLAGGLLAGTLWAGDAVAAAVADLYVAQVSADATNGAALDEAFGRALSEVLVKVTGRRTAATDPAARAAVGSAAPLVRQYQPVPGGMIRVQFDPAAVRRRLDAANLPIWADDRPKTLVRLMPGGAAVSPPGASMAPIGGIDAPGGESQILLATAYLRGVPIVVSPAGSAGGTGDPGGGDPLAGALAVASQQGADLVLIGRRLPASGVAAYRWTLAQGDERAEWQGDAVEGIQGLADRLASRYSAAASASRQLRLEVRGVDSFETYGRLHNYLRGVGLIQAVDVQRVSADAILFELTVRGDVAQLQDALALKAILEPVASGTRQDDVVLNPGGQVLGMAAADLTYRVVPVP